ncbi:unnamed protein product [Mucor hiemalis]
MDEDTENPVGELIPLMIMVRRNGEFRLEARPVDLKSDIIISDLEEIEQNHELIERQSYKVAAAFNQYRSKKRIGKRATRINRVYSEKQIDDFLSLIVEQHTVKYAASKCGIQPSTAYKLRRIWKENGMTIPVKKPRGQKD